MAQGKSNSHGRWLRLACPLAVLLLAGVAARAGAGEAGVAGADLTTLPLEDLMSLEVYSASRFLQKASQAPSSVTVIDAAQIRAFGWRTLAEALRSIRGLYTGNDRSYTYLGARGFLRPGDLNTRFLLQIDGTRINDPVFDQGQLGGEFPLELELIERIEFVPGPGSSIYGANAFFGVINVITKRAQDLEGVRASLESGQAGSRKATASYAWRSGERELLLSGSRFRSDGRDLYIGEFDTPEQNHGVARGLDWESGERLFARAQLGDWSMSLLGSERRKGIATAAFGQPFNAPGSSFLDRLRLAELAYRAAMPAQGELSAHLFHGAYDYTGTYINDDPERGINRDDTRARWWGGDASLFLQPGHGHKFVAGADYQNNYRLQQSNVNIAPPQTFLHERRQGRRLGLYLQDEMVLTKTVHVNAGLRHDQESSIGGVFSPRVALIASLSPQTIAKAMYGSAFRAPNNYELYYTAPGEGGQLANPELDRERIRSFELALVQHLHANARLTLSAYSNQVSALIGQVSDADSGLPIYRNAGKFDATGMELEYERKFGGGSVRASITRQHIRQHEANAGEVNSPPTLAKLNLAARLHGPWHAGVEAQYVGARRLLDGASAGAFLIANLNLYSIGLTRHLDASISASNLFDRRYADPASASTRQRAIVQDGRRLLFKLRYAY